MRALVVCPTAAGGHIDHAANVAAGLVRTGVAEVTILTRGGAGDYLGDDLPGGVGLDEQLPPRPAPAKRWLGFSSPRTTISTDAAVRRYVSQLDVSDLVVLEELRFPALALAGRDRRPRLTAIVHNARSHSWGRSRARSFARRLVDLPNMLSADLLLVHGAQQKQLLPRRIRSSTYVQPLPGLGAVDVARLRTIGLPPPIRDAFVCLGELRPNKGLELAIEAAGAHSLPLRIVGMDPGGGDYSRKLKQMAKRFPSVSLDERFVSAAEYWTELLQAKALVLPYSWFFAQSGPLAHACALSVTAICADVPALVEQGQGSPCVRFYQAGNRESLADQMDRVRTSATDPRLAAFDRLEPDEGWTRLALVLAGHRPTATAADPDQPVSRR